MRPLLAALALSSCLFFTVAAEASGKHKKPNFLFLLVDDLGWADVSWNNPDRFLTKRQSKPRSTLKNSTFSFQPNPST